MKYLIMWNLIGQLLAVIVNNMFFLFLIRYLA